MEYRKRMADKQLLENLDALALLYWKVPKVAVKQLQLNKLRPA